jgi:hypothetical protein
MKRRSYRVIGSEGAYDVEIERIKGGALEVHHTDGLGDADGGSKIVHTWKEAEDHAADLIGDAVRKGLV